MREDAKDWMWIVGCGLMIGVIAILLTWLVRRGDEIAEGNPSDGCIDPKAVWILNDRGHMNKTQEWHLVYLCLPEDHYLTEGK